MASSFLQATIKEFIKYRSLGEKAMSQVPDEALYWQYNPESNSMAMIVQHMSGNMLSRWTDMLTTDGEKDWRQRDKEFETVLKTREEVMVAWHRGWDLVMETLGQLREEDLERTIYIRAEAHTVTEAIVRQIAHYASHIGQLVYIGKMVMNSEWKSLSIPRHGSDQFNRHMMSGGSK
jgi:hypothetical protein